MSFSHLAWVTLMWLLNGFHESQAVWRWIPSKYCKGMPGDPMSCMDGKFICQEIEDPMYGIGRSWACMQPKQMDASKPGEESGKMPMKGGMDDMGKGGDMGMGGGGKDKGMGGGDMAGGGGGGMDMGGGGMDMGAGGGGGGGGGMRRRKYYYM